MRQAMKKHSGIDVPIKNANRSISNLTAQLSKHWEQYDQYDPSQDHNQEPELTGLFVSGYEGYQKRVGDMVREKHRRTLGNPDREPVSPWGSPAPNMDTHKKE
jgi:hypothetical protein